ncbi:MAG TPA: fibronectin type III domain-containing protein [Pseudomonadales bacterium]|nr:fibronectin type III domain-containing protein [Pseudomonadales bacterium]
MRGILILFSFVGLLMGATAANSQVMGSASISWSASPSSNVAGYMVYYGTSSGNYSSGVPVSNVTNVTINGLINGVKYYFAAAARDGSGNISSLSPEISGIVGSTSSPSAATLTSAIASPGQFAFTVSGASGNQYVVQASTDLVNWVSLQTNVVPFNFVDPNAGQFSRRFYRTVYIPN